MILEPIGDPPLDVVCLSHLRWDFVFQRPQHLLTRYARDHRVFYIEEPVVVPDAQSHLEIHARGPVRVVVPHVTQGLDFEQSAMQQRMLIDELLRAEGIRKYLLWYYTPMALCFTDHLTPRAIVYDCMDELSAFKGAPSGIAAMEQALLQRATMVFTGGASLYEAKRHLHPRVYLFPSSVDVPHFAKARAQMPDPEDQRALDRPRFGFYGVIDERMDLALLDGVAASAPTWQLVMLGPVAKIDPASLPQRPNLHFLGAKPYEELPRYLANWDVALLPFARNDATRFISPTKTPEYLAAGKPVVSTSIRDVVVPYGERRLVRIADEVPAFLRACQEALDESPADRVDRADAFLRHMSWDGTWDRIRTLLAESLSHRPAAMRAAQAPVATADTQGWNA